VKQVQVWLRSPPGAADRDLPARRLTGPFFVSRPASVVSVKKNPPRDAHGGGFKPDGLALVGAGGLGGETPRQRRHWRQVPDRGKIFGPRLCRPTGGQSTIFGKGASPGRTRTSGPAVNRVGTVKLADLHRMDITRCIDTVKDRGADMEANRVRGHPGFPRPDAQRLLTSLSFTVICRTPGYC